MKLYEMYLKNEANVSSIVYNTLRSFALAESGEYNPDFYPIDDAKHDIFLFLMDANGEFSEYCRKLAVKYGNIMRKDKVDEAKAQKTLSKFNFFWNCMEKLEWTDEEDGLFLGLVKSVCYIVANAASFNYKKCNNPNIANKKKMKDPKTGKIQYVVNYIDVDMKNCFKAMAGLDGSRIIANNDALINVNMAFYHHMSEALKLTMEEKLVLRHMYVNTWKPEELSGNLQWAYLNMTQISELYGITYKTVRTAKANLHKKYNRWLLMENNEKQKLLSEIAGTLDFQKKEYSECTELLYQISEYLIAMCENTPVFDTEDEEF